MSQRRRDNNSSRRSSLQKIQQQVDQEKVTKMISLKLRFEAILRQESPCTGSRGSSSSIADENIKRVFRVEEILCKVANWGQGREVTMFGRDPWVSSGGDDLIDGTPSLIKVSAGKDDSCSPLGEFSCSFLADPSVGSGNDNQLSCHVLLGSTSTTCHRQVGPDWQNCCCNRHQDEEGDDMQVNGRERHRKESQGRHDGDCQEYWLVSSCFLPDKTTLFSSTPWSWLQYFMKESRRSKVLGEVVSNTKVRFPLKWPDFKLRTTFAFLASSSWFGSSKNFRKRRPTAVKTRDVLWETFYSFLRLFYVWSTLMQEHKKSEGDEKHDMLSTSSLNRKNLSQQTKRMQESGSFLRILSRREWELRQGNKDEESKWNYFSTVHSLMEQWNFLLKIVTSWWWKSITRDKRFFRRLQSLVSQETSVVWKLNEKESGQQKERQDKKAEK